MNKVLSSRDTLLLPFKGQSGEDIEITLKIDLDSLPQKSKEEATTQKKKVAPKKQKSQAEQSENDDKIAKRDDFPVDEAPKTQAERSDSTSKTEENNWGKGCLLAILIIYVILTFLGFVIPLFSHIL